MTTKKQRRENVAAKSQAQRETQEAINLRLLEKSHYDREQRQLDTLRTAKKRQNAAAARAIADASKKVEVIPENLQSSYSALLSHDSIVGEFLTAADDFHSRIENTRI